MKGFEKYGLCLPTNEGYCAMYKGSDNKWHVIEDSFRKTRKASLKIADEYMFINQVETKIIECIY